MCSVCPISLILCELCIYYHKILNSHYCLPPTKEEVTAFARVCLSVRLLARLLKNAWVDLDEILRIVYRGLDIDELINF